MAVMDLKITTTHKPTPFKGKGMDKYNKALKHVINKYSKDYVYEARKLQNGYVVVAFGDGKKHYEDTSLYVRIDPDSLKMEENYFSGLVAEWNMDLYNFEP